ncbi:MAG: DUF2062 domain-containing protein [Kiloniellaceae bacterium]
MFKRRNPLPLHQRAGAFLWPRSGWRRSGAYVAHRLRRLPGTPYRIAAGFASGAAVSFTPFMGLHFVLAALLAVLVRGNVVASAIGTAVGNPWTFPFIWLWTYSLGNWILGSGKSLTESPEDLSFFHHIFDNPLDVLLPMLVGSVPTAVVAWFVFFWPFQRIVDGYQKARKRRLRKRVQKGRRASSDKMPANLVPDAPLVETRKVESQR